jgi:hypothetical protein
MGRFSWEASELTATDPAPGSDLRPDHGAEVERQPNFGIGVLRDTDTRYVTGYNRLDDKEP